MEVSRISAPVELCKGRTCLYLISLFYNGFGQVQVTALNTVWMADFYYPPVALFPNPFHDSGCVSQGPDRLWVPILPRYSLFSCQVGSRRVFFRLVAIKNISTLVTVITGL